MRTKTAVDSHTAYLDGQAAQAEGVPRRDNPFDMDDQESLWESWDEGWAAASTVVINAG